MSINVVALSGNLTRDPELRTTAGGTSVLSFGLAVNDRHKNATTGEWEDYANFVDCTMFGTRAESVAKLLAKGRKVSLAGKLRWSQWERDGQKRSKIEVIVNDIDICLKSSASKDESCPDGPDGAADLYDEDIPF